MMKHDELCEQLRWANVYNCQCAPRAYAADPFVDDGVPAMVPEVDEWSDPWAGGSL